MGTRHLLDHVWETQNPRTFVRTNDMSASLPPPVPRTGGTPMPRPVLRLGIRCTSETEFVKAFAKFVDPTSVVIPGIAHVALGTIARFVVLLANGQVVLSGDGKVVELFGSHSTPTKRKGVRLEVIDVDEQTRRTHAALLRARADGGTSPAPVRTPAATPAPAPVVAASERSTVRDLVPPPLERTPGSRHKLPANPLAELGDEVLGDFVECTIFEDEYAASGPVTTGAIEPPTEVTRRRRWARIARRWGPVLVSGAVSLCIGYLIWGTRRTATAEPLSSRREASAAIASAAPAATLARARVIAAELPRPRGVMPAPVGCAAEIVTQPDGVEVAWDGRPLGTAPLLDAPVPCGPAVVVLTHPRYNPVRLAVVARPGEPSKLSERLARPVAVLELTSTPARAVFRINKLLVGPAPARTSTMQFERISVTARLPGFKPWSHRIYVRSPRQAVHAELEPLPSPRAAPKRVSASGPASPRS